MPGGLTPALLLFWLTPALLLLELGLRLRVRRRLGVLSPRLLLVRLRPLRLRLSVLPP